MTVKELRRYLEYMPDDNKKEYTLLTQEQYEHLAKMEQRFMALRRAIIDITGNPPP